jgi:iron complex outermembrane receptor protein
MNFNGTFGNDGFNNTQMTVIPIGNLGSRNIDANLLGTGEAIANPITASDRYLESGNFFRFANFTLAWNFGTIGTAVSRGQLFITGTNLFNITNYTGFDPEVNTVNDSNGLPSFGIEYIPYPAVTSLLFGVRFAL